MFKEPITDIGKKSKKGRLTVEHEKGHWVTKEEGTGNPEKVTNQQCTYSNIIIPLLTGSVDFGVREWVTGKRVEL